MLHSGKKFGETIVQLTWKTDYMLNEFVVLEKRPENRILTMCVVFCGLHLTMYYRRQGQERISWILIRS